MSEILSREEIRHHTISLWDEDDGEEIAMRAFATIEAHDKGRRLALAALGGADPCGCEVSDFGRADCEQCLELCAAARAHAEQMRKDGWPDE